MSKNKGLGYITGLVVVIALLHFTALYFHLYWSLWWFDIMMHFLGGAWVGAFALWHIFRLARGISGKVSAALMAFLVTACIGVLWEGYEYMFGLSLVPHETYVFDTTLDIMMDMLGALTVSLLFALSSRKVTSL